VGTELIVAVTSTQIGRDAFGHTTGLKVRNSAFTQFEKGAVADLIGNTQLNVSKRRRKVPNPKDGGIKMMIEVVDLAMAAEK
jgi:hypothetical protein